ncbi:MAG: hypothetical protein EOP06_20220, partial [Proteobacteria bacterium]
MHTLSQRTLDEPAQHGNESLSSILLEKGINSFIRSVDAFNASNDRGRTESVLIFLNHSLEMLIKASVSLRGDEIVDRSTGKTTGFDHCLNKALNGGKEPLISEEQAAIIRIVNALRDPAQHYFV